MAQRRPTAGRGNSVLVGVLLLIAGAGSWAAAASMGRGSPKTVGGNVPVNASAVNKLDIAAHNSPSVAQNPMRRGNLVVVNRVDTPRFSCGLHVSFDGGSTWKDQELPFPAGEEQPPRCFAPDVAFGPGGTVHASFVTLAGLGNEPNALWAVTSTDGGRTMSTPVRVAGPLTFQARLSADPRREGRLYLSWVQGGEIGALAFAGTDNPVMVAHSDDGGSTWRSPVRVNPPSRLRALAPSTAVGPEGEVFLLYLDLGDDALDYHGGHEGKGGEPYQGRWLLVLARSVDRGKTWAEAVVDPGLVPAERLIAFFPPSPSLAVDAESGRVHAGFHDGRLGDRDVWVWTSGDGGRTFGPAVRVNDTARRDGTEQYLPKLAVAPNGRLDVVYYDRRADRSDLRNHVSLQSSRDGGGTFADRVRLSDRAFDSRIGFLSERGMPDLGSRLGLVSGKDRAVAVWTDTRAGTEASNKQDLARAVVSFPGPSPLRAPLFAAGLLALAAGIVVLASSRRARPSSLRPVPAGDDRDKAVGTLAAPGVGRGGAA